MTTAIMLETNKGNFEFAVALGIILLLIAFVVNSIAHSMQEAAHD
jgi:tungstate transport system permease protein